MTSKKKNRGKSLLVLFFIKSINIEKIISWE